MSITTNEMNLPMISAPAMGVTGDVNMAMDTSMDAAYGPEVDTSVAIGSPMNDHDASSITVYSNSISPVSYSAAQGDVAAFDIVFSVGITCPDGSCKTYQIVKRIGIDKCKIAHEAECSTPVSVVENKSELKEAAEATKQRFRRLAGLG